MTDFFDIAATSTVLDLQRQKGSLGMYVSEVGSGPGTPHSLTPEEIELITTRNSFYLASVGDTGWPYVQHRGGDAGFITVLDDHTIGWAERNGNRQYVGTGNITDNGRVAGILVDYPSRTRLKFYGRATYHADPAPDLVVALGAEEIRHDGAITIELLATAWNCPKYITPRYPEAEVKSVVDGLQKRITELEAKLADAETR
jgi:hypothetical protein